jgi:hypothetical protein
VAELRHPAMAMTPTVGSLKRGQRLRVASSKPALFLWIFAGIGDCKDIQDMPVHAY